jgi:hypothetical protein
LSRRAQGGYRQHGQHGKNSFHDSPLGQSRNNAVTRTGRVFAIIPAPHPSAEVNLSYPSDSIYLLAVFTIGSIEIIDWRASRPAS